MENQKKIGIMGGTFNPIHQGHLLLAESARCTYGLDEILFMPSGMSYMKNTAEIIDDKSRINMTALAIEDNPYFALSTLEIERAGATYTCETLAFLREKYPENEYYFIIGAYNLFSIEKWYKPQRIFDNCILVAAVRGDKDCADMHQKAEELQQKYHARILLLPERIIDLSSTEIRLRIKNGQSIRYMVPEKVYAYIEKNRLYQ